MADPAIPAKSNRSSMENFLDEYQYVRLGMSLLGTVLIGVVTLISGWTWRFGVVLVVLAAVLAHAVWSVMKGVRSPIPVLVLDLTLWGAVMALNYQNPVVNPGTFAFLSILPVMFANTFWTVAGFYGYLAAWYGVSYFMGAGMGPRTIGLFLSVLVTVAILEGVIARIRIWLGRLEANRSQMLGTVSHELRNNLTAMLGMTELVTTVDGIGADEAMELIELAHQQAVDATEIVDDLLTVSRLERSVLSLDQGPVDLCREVATTVHRFDGEGTVVSVTGEKLPAVEADSLRVRQILRNLISNAVRYGGDHIEVATRVAGNQAQVVVRDDGDGIPAEEVGTIFLPYRRSAKMPRTGTSVGLGLYISHHLAQAMGGNLTYSHSGEWTEFLLSLPARPDLPLPPEPAPLPGSVCV